MLELLFFLGLIGGFFSGLLGLGGAIIMVPLLLFVPTWLGLGTLDMKTVAAISMVQVFFASLSAVLAHWRHAHVHPRLVWVMGSVSAAASFLGAWLSRGASPHLLLLLFAIISSLAAVMMFIPKAETSADENDVRRPFSLPKATVIALVVGLVGGMIGAPGAFIYVPLLIYVLDIPTRITLGSTLAIVLLGSLTGVLGKMATGQVPWLMAVTLVAGAIPGAQVGAWLSKRTQVSVLRWLLAVFVVASAAKIWLSLGVL